METITPTLQTRIKTPDAPPEAAPENPREGFAQVMARQGRSNRTQENPVGLDREGTVPKAPLPPEEKPKQEGPDPANDPEVTSYLTTPISMAALPSSPNRAGEPPVVLQDPTLFLKLEAQAPNPALASKEQIGLGSRIQPGPGDVLIKSAALGVNPLDSLQPGTAGETRGPVLLSGLLGQVREGFRTAGETGPAAATVLVQPEGTLKETPVVLKGVEELLLHPAPESLPIKQEVSPEKTEKVLRSFQTTTEKSPSFSPQGPAISKTISIVDGQDPSPPLILRNFVPKGQDSVTATALELKPASQASPSEALPGTERVAAAPLSEGPPIREADPAESNSKIGQVSEKAVPPATLKEILSERESSSLARMEGKSDPEKPSPTTAALDPKTFLLHRGSAEKVEPGIPLRNPGENLSGSGEPERNDLIRFQEDTPLGVMAKFPNQPRVEGVPGDRLAEGPAKGSPEWIKEAFSVYQQYSKGLLRTLSHGGERIQMTLDPPQLGNILLEINRDRNLVTAHLWTDNPLTKELLDFSQGQLQKTLQLDGFKLDRFEVLVQPDLKSFQEDRWFGGRHPTWESSRERERLASPEGVILTSPEPATLRFSQGNQYVDTWV